MYVSNTATDEIASGRYVSTLLCQNSTLGTLGTGGTILGINLEANYSEVIYLQITSQQVQSYASMLILGQLRLKLGC